MMQLGEDEASMDLLDFVTLHNAPPRGKKASNTNVTPVAQENYNNVTDNSGPKVTLPPPPPLVEAEVLHDPPRTPPPLIHSLSEPMITSDTTDAQHPSKRKKLPDWMLLSPEQLRKVRKKRIREMKVKKDLLKQNACEGWDSTPSQQSQEAYSTPAPPSSGESCILTQAPVVETQRGFREVFEPIRQGRVIVFDLETSGFSAEDSIIEIGAVELIDGERTGLVFQSYAKALTAINPYAYEAHELSEEFLSHHSHIEKVCTNFIKWVGDSPLVAHNIRFDMRMLLQELRRWDLELQNNAYFCTMKYFQKKYPNKTYNLDAVSGYLGINKIIERTTHGALVDAEVCTRVYQHFLQQ